MKSLRFVIGAAAIALWMAFALSPRSGEGRRPEPDFDHASVVTARLQGRPLGATEALALPTRMRRVGPYLVVLDRYAERKVHLFDAATGALLASAGRDGDGPAELRVPWSVKPDPEGEGFWVLDVGLARLAHYRIERPASGTAVLAPDRTLRLETPAPLTDFTLLADGSVLASGFFPEGRFADFAPDGRFRGPLGALPEADGDVPAGVLLQAWQGRMSDFAGGSRIAIAYRHAGRLGVFDSSGRQVREIAGPFDFAPVFQVGAGERGPAMVAGDDFRLGYVDLAVSDRYLLGLFSGRTVGRAGPDAAFGRHVHVFDWEGRLVAAFELEADAIAIELGPDGTELLAVGHDPVPSIRAYRLPVE
jgi:hypothetical protein